MDTLIEEFDLKETSRFRGVMSADDVLAVLHHHWALSDDYYPEERQRLQHAGMIIFCASTTARAGSVVESTGYFGRNEAMEYGDIQLYAVRDDQHPGGIKLGMLVQLRLLKGRRNRGNPSVSLPPIAHTIVASTDESIRPKIKFTERRDVPSFCLIKVILAQAFKDNAFASKWISEPDDIYNIQIPDRLKSVPIEWAENWRTAPIFRRTVRDTAGKIHTSPTLASQYSQMATWNRRLGRSFGMKEPFEFKMLRRAAAAALTSKTLCTDRFFKTANRVTESAPDGVRNQAMGHSNSQIHDRYYQNQILAADIVSAFLDTPSDEALMKLMGHMSLTRDPQAPSKPTPAQCDQVRNDPEVKESRKSVEELTKALRERYGPITKARKQSKGNPGLISALKARDRKKRDHDCLYKRKLAMLFETSREHYFATLGATCLENQHLGRPEPEGPAVLGFRFSERADLVKLLFPAPRSQPASYEEQIRDSSQIIRLYAALCERRETPRLRQQTESYIVEESRDIKPCFLDTDPDIYPMKCPGTQCLFCLGDSSLTASIRTRCFSKPYTLTRHVHKQHLNHIPTKQSFLCPHPSCAIDGVILENSDHFKAHALHEHNIVHSA